MRLAPLLLVLLACAGRPSAAPAPTVKVDGARCEPVRFVPAEGPCDNEYVDFLCANYSVGAYSPETQPPEEPAQCFRFRVLAEEASGFRASHRGTIPGVDESPLTYCGARR